jgi:hypothetical protein
MSKEEKLNAIIVNILFSNVNSKSGSMRQGHDAAACGRDMMRQHAAGT